MSAFRIPLAGPYTSRISAVNASDSTSGYVGVGIVGLMIVGKTTQSTDKDARYINCFASTVSDNIAGKKRVYTVKRPGFGTQSTPASGHKGFAVLVWTGQGSGTKVISAFKTGNSEIYDGTTSLGLISGQCTGLTETDISAVATITATGDDSSAWYYDTGVGVMTEITDAQYPGNIAGKTVVGTFAHMDGYALIMTSDGYLYASDVNSVIAWTANSSKATNSYPDKGVGCVRYKNFIMACGTESIEFYYNNGQSPFPFAKSVAMTLKVGAVSADAIAQISDTTFFVGSTPQGGISLFQFDGSLSRISTPEIDSIMILAGASNISVTTIRFYGRSFVLVKAGPTTLVYCVEEKFWHEWNTTTPLWYKCAGVSVGGTMVNYAISNVSTSGKVFLMNQASLVFTDNGDAYTARIQLPPMDLGTKKRKFWTDVELVCDQETSASTITLAYSDTDYQGYVTVGTGDLSDERVRWTRLGSSRKRAWVLTHAAATPMRIEAMEGNVTIGTG